MCSQTSSFPLYLDWSACGSVSCLWTCCHTSQAICAYSIDWGCGSRYCCAVDGGSYVLVIVMYYTFLMKYCVNVTLLTSYVQLLVSFVWFFSGLIFWCCCRVFISLWLLSNVVCLALVRELLSLKAFLNLIMKNN